MRRRRRNHRGSRWPVIVFAVVALITVSAMLLRVSWDDLLKRQYPIAYGEIIEKEAENFDLDPMLVCAIIQAESGFDAQVESPVGACGLMQLMPETFEWMQTKLDDDHLYADEDIFLPEVNIRYGCALLRLLTDLYGSEESAICAYNAGMGNVARWLEDPAYSADGIHLDVIPYPETEAYLQRVLRNFEQYTELYGEKSK